MSSSNQQVLSDVLFSIENYARGMWRYRWHAVIVAWLVSMLGWAHIYSMPNIYRASARIYVDTENALAPLLKGIALTSNVMNEVAIVTREMISRPNLAEVARSTDLHLRANTDAQFEALLSSLQKRISVKGGRDNIYVIDFEDKDRGKALAVVDSLVDTFVERSLGADRTEASSAQTFLMTQIAEYEKRLTAAEDKLATFKRENVQFMPDKNGGYFARLQAARSELEQTTSQLRLAQRKRTELNRQLEGEVPVFGIMSSTPTSSGGGAAAGRIAAMEAQLDELRLRYTDKHPRIAELLDTIALLEEEQMREIEAASDGGRSLPQVDNPLNINPVYQNIRIQLSNLEVEIAGLQSQLSAQQRAVAANANLVDTVPRVEAELSRLNRDYEVVQTKYQQLVQQLETANIGESVDKTVDEVQFRIIDPPYSAFEPAGPDRGLLISGVFILAIGLAGAVAFLMNLLNPVIFDARSVTEVFKIPVLGSVSLMESPAERRHRLMIRLRFGGGLGLLAMAFFVAIRFADKAPRIVEIFAGGVF